jgi:branched-chain amino acid transport system substrate-binding protein
MKNSYAGTALAFFLMVFFCSPTIRAEIKVGIAAPLSGNSLNAGEQQEIGALTAIEVLNRQGGLLGEEIVTISVNDACDSSKAKAVARQLVSEGVILVIGHLCSGCSLAASKIYEEAGIIMITPGSSNPKVTDEGGPNVFRVFGRDDQQGKIAGDYLADNLGNKNIAILHDGDAYGKGLAEITKRQLNKRGVTEVLFNQFAANQRTYNRTIEKLVEKEVDVIYIGGYEADVGIILRQAKGALPNIRLFSGDALMAPDFLLYAGDAGAGTYFTFVPDMRLNPEAADVVDFIRNEYSFEPEGFTLYSYGAVQAWAQAAQQARSLDQKAVINALHEGSFNTVLGTIGFDAKGDATGISSFVWYVYDEEGYTRAD